MYAQAHVRIWTLSSWYVLTTCNGFKDKNLYTNIWTFFIIKLEIIVSSLSFSFLLQEEGFWT